MRTLYYTKNVLMDFPCPLSMRNFHAQQYWSSIEDINLRNNVTCGFFVDSFFTHTEDMRACKMIETIIWGFLTQHILAQNEDAIE